MSSTVEPALRLAAPSVARSRRPEARIGGVRVLDEDPDLAMQLSGIRLQEARARLVARMAHRAKGEWSFPRSREAGEPRLGVLVLDGVLVRDVLMEDTVSTELIGAGDLVRPSPVEHPSRLLRTDVRWTVLEPARVALLGRSFADAVTDYPEVSAALFDRVSERAERLAVTQAICQLNGVDRRVLSLLWHLAERWGRVGAGGVVVPLPLPHRIVASMVGARRPTVSTAIARLTTDGTIERRPDGTWLLRDEPVGLPTEATSRFVPLRRRTVTAEMLGDADGAGAGGRLG